MNAMNVILLVLLTLVMGIWALVLLDVIAGRAVGWLPFFAVLLTVAFVISRDKRV